MLPFAIALALQTTLPGEETVDPYPQSNANAGAIPCHGTAMLRREGVPFFAQNRFLAKLASVKRDVVES